MNRLQKKCLIAAAGTHLLLVVALLCSGFVRSKPKTDNSQVLIAIPQNVIDAALSSGVRNATPPPPAPITPPQPPQPPQPQPQPQVHPEPPKPVVKPPPEPVRQPEPEQPDRESPEPAPKPPKKHTIDVDLTKTVRKVPTRDDKAEQAEQEREQREAQKAAQRARDAKLVAFRSAFSSIRNNTASSTTIDMPGDSSVSYANYGAVVVSIYFEAWRLPQTLASDDTVVKVSVTIARDGHVISAHVIEPSGDSAIDRSVQSTLDRVRMIAPFPEGSTDTERTYKINFKPIIKKQMAG
ncbi:MAG TPA: TonB family protein [Verrucomicrobiae bacterium]